MSGRAAKVTQKKRSSKSEKSGLVMPVSRFLRALKKGDYSKRVSVGSGVYIAAVVEFLVAEVMELAGKASIDNNKKRISPRHIQLAIRNDEEISKMCAGVVIAQGGVLPNLHPALLKKRKDWKVADTAMQGAVESEQEEKSSNPPRRSQRAAAAQD